MVSPNVIWPHQCTTTPMFCLENRLAPVPFEARQFSGTSDSQIPLPDSTTLHSLREHHSNVGIEAGKIVTERDAMLAGILIVKLIYLEEDAILACILIVRFIYLLCTWDCTSNFKYRN